MKPVRFWCLEKACCLNIVKQKCASLTELCAPKKNNFLNTGFLYKLTFM